MTEQGTTMTSAQLADPIWRRLLRLLGRKRFGAGGASEVVAWAVGALVAGWDSPGLRMLAGLDGPLNEEVDQFVERTMRELGVQPPNDAQLASLYSELVAADMLAGSTPARVGAREMFHIWLGTGCPKDLQRWSGFEDQYELARDGVYGDVAEVEREILQEAQRIVEQSERPPTPPAR